MLTSRKMLSNPITETKANREGINYVINRMSWYWELSSRVLGKGVVNEGSSEGLRCEFEKRVVDLYKALLSYQMKSVYSYYRKRGLVFFRDLVMFDDWDGNLQNVKDAEDVFRQD